MSTHPLNLVAPKREAIKQIKQTVVVGMLCLFAKWRKLSLTDSCSTFVVNKRIYYSEKGQTAVDLAVSP